MTHSLRSSLEKENEGLENVKTEASQVAEDMAKLGAAIQGLAADSWQGVRTKLAEIYETGQGKASNVEKKIASRIRAQPMQALLIAAGVGFVIGWLKRK